MQCTRYICVKIACVEAADMECISQGYIYDRNWLNFANVSNIPLLHKAAFPVVPMGLKNVTKRSVNVALRSVFYTYMFCVVYFITRLPQYMECLAVRNVTRLLYDKNTYICYCMFFNLIIFSKYQIIWGEI